QLVRLALVGDAERAAGAMEVVGAALLILGLAEIRQHVLPAPADIAELAPSVEILLLAADIDEAVDRAGAAQHLAARLDDAAAVEPGLGLAFIEPVDLRIAEELAVAERDVDPRIAVGAAGLEQEHAVLPPLRQAIGQDAARRPAADDDIIECAEIPHGTSPTPLAPESRLRSSARQALDATLLCR